VTAVVANCGLCGAAESTVVHQGLTPTRYGSASDSFGLVRCDACGLVYLSPRPSAEEIGRFYPQEFYGELTADTSGPRGRLASLYNRLFPSADARRLDSMLTLVRRHWPGLPGRVLDVGAGDGNFLDHMTRAGWQGEGTELCADSARIAARRASRNRIHVGALEDLELEAGAYDMVTLWDVLEHLYRPLEALRKARSLLRPGGLLLVSVPNYHALEAHLMGRRWPHLDVPRHLHHFTPPVLDRMLAAAGFDDRRTTTAYRTLMEHMPRALLPLRAAMDEWAGGAAGYAARLTDDAFGVLLAPARAALARMDRGCALVAIARRERSET
jgi:SAM-dependent methyltransferase